MTLTGTPVKSLHVVDLQSGHVRTGTQQQGIDVGGGVSVLTYDPSTPSTPLSPLSPAHNTEGSVASLSYRGLSNRSRPRRDSMDSNVSEVSTTSTLFRINEVPSSGFSIAQVTNCNDLQGI